MLQKILFGAMILFPNKPFTIRHRMSEIDHDKLDTNSQIINNYHNTGDHWSRS